MHHELPARLDVEHYRKDAKALVRAYRAGVPDAVEQAEEVLGERARARFQLSDAQYVIASEHGHRSWGDFRRALESAEPEAPVGRIGLADIPYYERRAADLAAALASGDEEAARRIEANLPRFAGGTALSPSDAKVVVAREYGFPTWRQLVHFVRRARDAAAQEPRDVRVLGREAVAAGDTERLHALLAEHAGLGDDLLEDLTQPDVFGEGLGHALGVDRGIAERLVERAGNRDECLNLAACFDRVALVQLLLDAGADDESVEIWGITPLETALYHGARAAAELLAARKIVPLALWTAAALGRVDLLEELHGTAGAGAHRPDLSKVGWPPGAPPRDDPQELLDEALVHAARNGRDAAVAWLLDQGANVDAGPYLGLTALHVAVEWGHLSTVRLLVERGARLDVVGGARRRTALDWAVSNAERDPSRTRILDFLELRASSGERLDRIAADLEAAQRGWGERGETVLEGGVDYVAGEPVRVRVRRRGRNLTIDDEGAAVARAGRPDGWLDVARRVAEDGFWLNVNRRGVVFVPAFEGRIGVPWLVLRVADAAAAVYQELLELDK
jgi:ankyrin repeat protein